MASRTPRCSEWRRPNMSPNAYDVASVTAEAPTIDASNRSSAKIAPAAGVRLWCRPCATRSPSLKWPNSDVPEKADEVAIMIAAAPTTTTNAPSTVSAFS